MGNIRCPAGTVTIHLTVQQFVLTVSNVVLNNIPNRIHALCPVHRLPEYLITPGHKMRLIQALRIPFEKVQEIPIHLLALFTYVPVFPVYFHIQPMKHLIHVPIALFHTIAAN